MSFNAERLSHAYITNGSFAETLAMAVVCGNHTGERPCKSCVHCGKASRNIHPDIIKINRLDNKLIISVDQIRELKRDVYVVPNDAMQKAYVVYDADSMNTNAQNAFLQILEEPPAHAVFILSTDNPAALLPTVRSRCVELKSHTPEVAGDDIEGHEGLEETVKSFIQGLTGNNVKLMECMFRIDKLERHAFQSFLTKAREAVITELRKNTIKGNMETSKALIRAEIVLTKAEEMSDFNVSAGHISGFICASLL